MSFSYCGSFSSCVKEGNGFIFPTFKAKIDFPDDEQRLNLFAFNPKFEVQYYWIMILYNEAEVNILKSHEISPLTLNHMCQNYLAIWVGVKSHPLPPIWLRVDVSFYV